MTDEVQKIVNDTADVLLAPIRWGAWLLSLPIQTTSWIIITVKTHRYDPEKRPCPACAFKGDSGTGKKSCKIRFTRTNGKDKANLEHVCFRCSAEYYSGLAIPADKWLGNITQAEMLKAESARLEL